MCTFECNIIHRVDLITIWRWERTTDHISKWLEIKNDSHSCCSATIYQEHTTFMLWEISRGVSAECVRSPLRRTSADTGSPCSGLAQRNRALPAELTAILPPVLQVNYRCPLVWVPGSRRPPRRWRFDVPGWVRSGRDVTGCHFGPSHIIRWSFCSSARKNFTAWSHDPPRGFMSESFSCSPVIDCGWMEPEKHCGVVAPCGSRQPGIKKNTCAVTER